MLALLIAVYAGAGQSPYSAELKRIAAEDQADRGFSGKGTAEQVARMKTHDRARQKRVREILAAAGTLTGDDFSAAGLVFQHGDSPDDYALAHELALCAGALGKLSSLPALTEDRFLTNIGRRQRFGTQFSFVGEATRLDPVDEGKPTSVNDDLRLDYMVPPLAVSREKGLASIRASFDLVVARIESRRNTKHPLAGEPAIARELAKLHAGLSGEARVISLYRDGKLITDSDLRDAARILSASADPDTLMLAHEFAGLALMEGDKRAASIVELSWDRFFGSVHRPPRTSVRRTFRSIGVALHGRG